MKAGAGQIQILHTVYKAGLKVHSLPSARLNEVKIFPLLIDSMIIAHSQPSAPAIIGQQQQQQQQQHILFRPNNVNYG